MPDDLTYPRKSHPAPRRDGDGANGVTLQEMAEALDELEAMG
jgi:hypothetical protein